MIPESKEHGEQNNLPKLINSNGKKSREAQSIIISAALALENKRLHKFVDEKSKQHVAGAVQILNQSLQPLYKEGDKDIYSPAETMWWWHYLQNPKIAGVVMLDPETLENVEDVVRAKNPLVIILRAMIDSANYEIARNILLEVSDVN